MDLAGHAVGLLAQLLQRTSVGARGQVQLVVVLLQVPQRNRSDDRKHAIAASVCHRHHVTIDLLGCLAIAAELVRHTQRAVGCRAHGQVVLGQPLQRQGCLARNRGGITPGHRFPGTDSVQFTAPASIRRVRRGQFNRRLGAEHGGPHLAVQTGRQIGPRQHQPE